MNIAFAGFRHGHIFGLYNSVLDSNTVKLCGCYEEDAKTVVENPDINFNYKTYDEILNDATVDIVAIGDYYQKRGRMIIEALKHGKHVICDKPICTDLKELSEIEKLSEEKNLKVACMLDLRYITPAKQVKRLIEDGEIGEIQIASFTGQHCIDYENRPKWYFEDGKHGGTINDIAIHGIDLVRFITAKNLTKINAAKVWNAFADKALSFKDCGQFMIEMENISVMGDVSYSAPKFSGILPTYWNFYFWGTKGMINFNLKDECINIYKESHTVIKTPSAKPDYLNDLISEIKGERTIMSTKEILLSQRQVLKIQEFSDKEA